MTIKFYPQARLAVRPDEEAILPRQLVNPVEEGVAAGMKPSLARGTLRQGQPLWKAEGVKDGVRGFGKWCKALEAFQQSETGVF